jgi:hypothetical protein
VFFEFPISYQFGGSAAGGGHTGIKKRVNCSANAVVNRRINVVYCTQLYRGFVYQKLLEKVLQGW